MYIGVLQEVSLRWYVKGSACVWRAVEQEWKSQGSSSALLACPGSGACIWFM